MTTINKLWYTHENNVSVVTFMVLKEHIEKEKTRDQKLAKIISRTNILSKNIIGDGGRSVKLFGRQPTTFYLFFYILIK